jgi:hypothetical protein
MAIQSCFSSLYEPSFWNWIAIVCVDPTGIPFFTGLKVCAKIFVYPLMRTYTVESASFASLLQRSTLDWRVPLSAAFHRKLERVLMVRDVTVPR